MLRKASALFQDMIENQNQFSGPRSKRGSVLIHYQKELPCLYYFTNTLCDIYVTNHNVEYVLCGWLKPEMYGKSEYFDGRHLLTLCGSRRMRSG